jgi:methyltransferase (TIGR00027 family)
MCAAGLEKDHAMTTTVDNHQKPIRSAEAVSMLRAASAREQDATVRNPDYLATHFVGGGLYGMLLRLPHALSRRLIERISPGSYCYFLARTQFIDGHLNRAIDNGVRQIVILGAGYDSRASRFQSRLGRVRLFEVDLSATQQAKRERMARHRIEEPAQRGLRAARLQPRAGDFGLEDGRLRSDAAHFLHLGRRDLLPARSRGAADAGLADLPLRARQRAGVRLLAAPLRRRR